MDLIDRQAAIDEIENYEVTAPDYMQGWAVKLIEAIKGDIRGLISELPSAQPTQKKYSNSLDALDCVSRQAAIDVEGIDEQIRCEMCRNPMHTDRGCDGCCEYDEKLYERIMKILDERIKPLPFAQPETAKRIVGKSRDGMTLWYQCDMCNEPVDVQDEFCRGCGRRLTDG